MWLRTLLLSAVVAFVGFNAGMEAVAVAATSAAPTDQASTGRASRQAAPLQLVVFERERCGVCQAFRSRIAPRYEATDAGARAPIRYVDIDGPALSKAGLGEALHTLPTAVLMRDGVEIDRVTGLWAPDTFQAMVEAMLERVD